MLEQKNSKISTKHVLPGSFDLEGERVTHARLGVWDIYEVKDVQKAWFSWSVFETIDELLSSLPFVVHAFKTLAVLCHIELMVYLTMKFATSILPAMSLYHSNQLLELVQEAVDTKSVDRALLLNAIMWRISCVFSIRLANMIEGWAAARMASKMRSYYSIHVLSAQIRLDVPTYADPVVRGQLRLGHEHSTVVWSGIVACIRLASFMLQLTTQFSVLVGVLRRQPDGTLIALFTFATPALKWINRRGFSLSGVWAATCRNTDYLRTIGLKSLVENVDCRKEVVAGNLQEYIRLEFEGACGRLGDKGDKSVFEAYHSMKQGTKFFYFASLLVDPLEELPQLMIVLRAFQSPSSIPISLASLALIRQTVSAFEGPLFSLLHGSSTMSHAFSSIRCLYEMKNIPNQVIDGPEPYPEDQQTTQTGMEIEFRDVSYKYPGNNNYAIRNVSFKVGPGQLCVLVGSNGSGKSTLLKLMVRLYDPSEGIILVDDRDIKTLKLTDLRQCISVLFQDYSHFPLSIKENIGMGNPRHVWDKDRIKRAAELGGAADFVEKLPDGYDTVINRPVDDYYSGLPEGTKTIFGRQVRYGAVKAHIGVTENTRLSGGQMQRLAVSRTFMGSLGDETDVGLLLFDEPSASLDPEAEHDLFERLRVLRGNKTMVFSSHRYGQLTRHADLIIYMGNSTVLELGTHEELLKTGGEYSKIYNIQASYFK